MVKNSNFARVFNLNKFIVGEFGRSSALNNVDKSVLSKYIRLNKFRLLLKFTDQINFETSGLKYILCLTFYHYITLHYIIVISHAIYT